MQTGLQTLNRTILELKSRSEAATLLRLPVPQSHHTGIEIFLYLIRVLVRATPQSHHTGIEITITQRTPRHHQHPQSHHTGIEMMLAESGGGYPRIPSIAPYWNWNKQTFKSKCCYCVSLNRTILELKCFTAKACVLHVFYPQSHHTGIEI